MPVSTLPEISHLSVSRPELINVLRQMGKQVKWPQKMKAPDSFRNPGFWCDFHPDHGHKTEDCVALKIEVNELLKKGHLRCWEKIFHEEITPAYGFQVLASRFRGRTAGSGSLPPGLGPCLQPPASRQKFLSCLKINGNLLLIR